MIQVRSVGLLVRSVDLSKEKNCVSVISRDRYIYIYIYSSADRPMWVALETTRYKVSVLILCVSVAECILSCAHIVFKPDQHSPHDGSAHKWVDHTIYKYVNKRVGRGIQRLWCPDFPSQGSMLSLTACVYVCDSKEGARVAFSTTCTLERPLLDAECMGASWINVRMEHRGIPQLSDGFCFWRCMGRRQQQPRLHPPNTMAACSPSNPARQRVSRHNQSIIVEWVRNYHYLICLFLFFKKKREIRWNIIESTHSLF